MNYIKQLISVLNLINDSNQPVGKTYIQKGIFLLQEGLKENLGYEYKIHYYGPYSQEVTDILYDLEDMNYLDIKYDDENECYKIQITEKGINYLNEKREEYEIQKEKINLVKSLIEDASVDEMELISTTLFFSKITKTEASCIEQVMIAKPHFKEKQIKDAFNKLKDCNLV